MENPLARHLCDVELICDDGSFYFSKCVLTLESKYFERLFSAEWGDKKQTTLLYTKKNMLLILQHMLKSPWENLSEKEVDKLLLDAEYFMIPSLFDALYQYICQYLKQEYLDILYRNRSPVYVRVLNWTPADRLKKFKIHSTYFDLVFSIFKTPDALQIYKNSEGPIPLSDAHLAKIMENPLTLFDIYRYGALIQDAHFYHTALKDLLEKMRISGIPDYVIRNELFETICGTADLALIQTRIKDLFFVFFPSYGKVSISSVTMEEGESGIPVNSRTL